MFAKQIDISWEEVHMARSFGNNIADSLQLTLGYAERLLKGVTPEQFARFARPGGQVVASNHAAFVYGHLSLYGPRILDHLGQDSSTVAVPVRFQELFSKDAKCQDDPDGSIYPPMDVITDAFFNGYKAALAALREVGDEALQKPNPMGPPMNERFPTMGSMHAFYAGGHAMMHLGQVSAWRRMLGLPPA